MGTHTSSQYIGYCIVLFGLFAGYVALTAGLYENACSPTRDGYATFAIPTVIGMVVLSLMNAIILPKVFRSNVRLFDLAVPAPMKLVAAVIVFGGIGYHINVFGGC